MLEQGPVEQKIIESCIRDRRPLPPRIANAPELELGLDLFFNAFTDLTTCRSVGQGEGPIPWTAVTQWCNENRIHGVQREDLRYHVNRLDSVYTAHRVKQAKQATEKNGPAIIQSPLAGSGPRGRSKR